MVYLSFIMFVCFFCYYLTITYFYSCLEHLMAFLELYPVSMWALLLYYNKSLLLVVRLLKKKEKRKTHSVHIQWVHSEVVWMQVKGLKELLHGDLLPFEVVHYTFSIHTVRLFDEAQQVLLVHAGSSMDVSVHLERNRDGRVISEVFVCAM